MSSSEDRLLRVMPSEGFICLLFFFSPPWGETERAGGTCKHLGAISSSARRVLYPSFPSILSSIPHYKENLQGPRVLYNICSTTHKWAAITNKEILEGHTKKQRQKNIKSLRLATIVLSLLILNALSSLKKSIPWAHRSWQSDFLLYSIPFI